MLGLLFWLCIIVILYAYAGYPILLTLFAFSCRKRPEYPPSPHPPPLVTLFITAYNEEAIIGQKLENSIALDYHKDFLQILVSADGSDDQTVEIVRNYEKQGVELSYTEPRRGKMAAINRSIGQARGDIIIFSDANNMYASDVINELVAPFSDSNVGGVSGAKTILRGDGVLGESEGIYWKYESYIKKQETRLGCCIAVVGEIFAVRRSFIEPWPDGIINDDFYIAMRLLKAGHRIVYTDKARSMERVSFSAQDEIDRRSRIIAGRYQAIAMMHKLLSLSRPIVAWQVVSHKFMRPLVPLAMAGAFLTNLMLVCWPQTMSHSAILFLLPPVNWYFFIMQMLFYLLAWIGNRQKQYHRVHRYLYLPTFLVNSNLAALLGLYRFLTQSQSTLWQRAERPKMGECMETEQNDQNK